MTVDGILKPFRIYVKPSILIFRLGTQDFVIGLYTKGKLNFNKHVEKGKLNW